MKKIKNSFGGIIGGIILLIAGTCLLWWNEGNNVKNIATTNEVEKNAIEVKSDKVDSNNDGKLVLVSDKLNVVDEEVIDTEFDVSLKKAQDLTEKYLGRKVEIGQTICEEDEIPYYIFDEDMIAYVDATDEDIHELFDDDEVMNSHNNVRSKIDFDKASKYE